MSTTTTFIILPLFLFHHDHHIIDSLSLHFGLSLTHLSTNNTTLSITLNTSPSIPPCSLPLLSMASYFDFFRSSFFSSHTLCFLLHLHPFPFHTTSLHYSITWHNFDISSQLPSIPHSTIFHRYILSTSHSFSFS